MDSSEHMGEMEVNKDIEILGIGDDVGPLELSPSNDSANGTRDEYQIDTVDRNAQKARAFNRHVHDISEGQTIPINPIRNTDTEHNYYSVHARPQPVKLQKNKPISSSFGPRPASIGSFLSNSEHLSGDPPVESSGVSKK